MKDYVVKLRFWLRAYDSTEISAATDAEAFHLIQSRPWSVDQTYEYQGRPEGFRVDVVDEAGAVHMLDPRLDLRNHSPTGLSWGYSGSGPAQLALAILSHALHCDERAEELYQEFKDAVVSRFDQNQPWHLTTEDVLGWVMKHPSVTGLAVDA